MATNLTAVELMTTNSPVVTNHEFHWCIIVLFELMLTLKDEVSLWVLFSRAFSAVTYISNTTLVKSA